MNFISRIERATLTADQHAEARLLQDVHVVVVGVPHGPTGTVPPRLLAVRTVHVPTMAVCPLLERVVASYLREGQIEIS